jgi:hypothetical protein
MQPPVSSRTETHKKTHTFQNVRENASFSEVVGMLDDARVAADGIEQVLQALQKCPPVFKGEAKSQAAVVDGVSNVTAWATWLSQNLSHDQLTELASQLRQEKQCVIRYGTAWQRLAWPLSYRVTTNFSKH